MRYFKATITYELPSHAEQSSQFEKNLYCSSQKYFPTSDQLRKAFYANSSWTKKFLSSHWNEIAKEDIPETIKIYEL